MFANDSIEKVVRFTFEDEFITEDIKQEAYNDNLKKFHHFDGVKFIDTYYETTRFKYLVYVKGILYMHHLIDNATGKQYKFGNNLTAGLLPSNVLCVMDNKLYYLITKQNVEDLRYLIKPTVLNEELSKSDDAIKRIFNGEESLPLILSVEIKK